MFREYSTVLGQVETKNEIKKSIFITNLKRCNSEDEALEFIDQIKKQYRDATHNCSCYVIGDTKLIQRYNDDGEPQGSAGIPMLEVLLKEDLTNICAVATRYFGGVKLGASGLIRAYGSGVTQALGEIKRVRLTNFYKVDLSFDYVFLGKIDNYLQEKKIFVKDRQYLEKIDNILYIQIEKFEKFKEEIYDITSANCKLDIMENILLQVSDNEIVE